MLIRYPGSKAKLVTELWRFFPAEMTTRLWSSKRPCEYREPFFGAGAIGFKILDELHPSCVVWINDIDEDLVCLWKTVKENPKRLARLVTEFTPSVEAFYDFKKRDGSHGSAEDRGFRKLALHRMSVSGFGVKSGGPIGGRSQKSSSYTVDCRWNPERIKRDIFRLGRLLNKFAALRITCGDFAPLVESAHENCFIYLDPPYYEKGAQLYRYPMPDSCHARLAKLLLACKASWALSYDDHPRVRELYDWAQIHELFITYTNAITTKIRPKNRELVIVRGD